MKSELEMLEELTIEDLQEQHRQYAEVIGLDNLIALSKAFGGGSIYVPQTRELIKNRLYNSIFQEFDGGNIKPLAAKYGVSESTVYNIVREKILRGTARREAAQNIEGQMNILDYPGIL